MPMASPFDYFQHHLASLEQENRLRHLIKADKRGLYVKQADRYLLNLSGNDYLGLAANADLVTQFLDTCPSKYRSMGASSSRLLTGNEEIAEILETALSEAFNGRAVLTFNSGYHMNSGILPALSREKTLILSDEYNHASIIDGIRLSKATCLRFKHNDLEHLNALLEEHHDCLDYDRIIVATESIFSMDGDEVDLLALVALKKKFPKTLLYIDEAHAFGVRGEQGLGCAEQYGVIDDIDLLCGTFGKAAASHGGYLVCQPLIKDYLINTMRTLIFSTALPAHNLAWTLFTFSLIKKLSTHRQQLDKHALWLRQALEDKNIPNVSSSHIVPVIMGENDSAVRKAQQMQAAGFYILPIRAPTVPQGSARVRISLHARLSDEEMNYLIEYL